MGNELIDKYAFEAVDLIRTKEVSSSELLKASQERHLEVDEQVNALPYTLYDKALTKAKIINIDSERQNKKSLLGLPIAVKDYNDVAGVPTTFGSKIFRGTVVLGKIIKLDSGKTGIFFGKSLFIILII